jgi:HPt (histidine-containing phosphotransfer) domain-containing protein
LSEIDDALARLRERFIARCEGDLADLRRWTADPANAPDDLVRLVHRIAGAAGTFGFADLSDRAKAAEDALVTGAPGREAELARLIEALQPLTERAAAG